VTGVKYVLLQLGVLIGAALLLVGLGRSLAVRMWGPAGAASLDAAAGICLAAAALATLPVGLAVGYRRTYAPYAALAGTVIRLLTTAALAIGYQALVPVHRASFFGCLLAIYLMLLIIETGLSIGILLRVDARPHGKSE